MVITGWNKDKYIYITGLCFCIFSLLQFSLHFLLTVCTESNKYCLWLMFYAISGLRGNLFQLCVINVINIFITSKLYQEKSFSWDKRERVLQTAWSNKLNILSSWCNFNTRLIFVIQTFWRSWLLFHWLSLRFSQQPLVLCVYMCVCV